VTNANPISVSQLNTYIKQIFEAEELLHNIYVIGEISGIKLGGNVTYFDIKDEDACISCACFVPPVMQKGGKLYPDGTKVVVRGTVSYWNKRGKISFNVDKCAEYGIGEGALMLEALKTKLRAEGLFDADKKKPLPKDIKTIGVITSRTGAVIRDIITVSTRRDKSINIVLFDTRVQGLGAEMEIVDGINLFNSGFNGSPVSKPDVLIVARGGGSFEDLAPFNTEILARTVFASQIPVVSAVGHESDYTLVDFVADLRAPTPSAAAELCVREVRSDIAAAITLWRTLKSMVAHRIEIETKTDIWVNLKNVTERRIQELLNHTNLLSAQIESNNPLAVLRRGFTKTDKDLGTIKIGDEFEIMYYNDGIKKGVAEWKKNLQ
jgi:exodeoxyribonuclease VII large subunit